MKYSLLENFSSKKDTKIQKRFRRTRLRWREYRDAKVIRNRGIYLSVDAEQISSNVKKTLFRDQYEHLEFAILNATLKPSDVVMEVGAGLGFISIFAAKIAGSANVFTYEANPSLLPLIEKNYKLNKVNPTISNCALTNTTETGVRKFYLVEDFWGSSTFKRNASTTEIEVPALPFKKELARINASFLMVDIEGGEKELFEDVSLDGVRCALIEMHPDLIGEDGVLKITANLSSQGLIRNEKISIGNVYFYERKI